MMATFESEEPHCADDVRSCVLPSEYVPVALSEVVAETDTDAGLGETETVIKVGVPEPPEVVLFCTPLHAVTSKQTMLTIPIKRVRCTDISTHPALSRPLKFLICVELVHPTGHSWGGCNRRVIGRIRHIIGNLPGDKQGKILRTPKSAFTILNMTIFDTSGRQKMDQHLDLNFRRHAMWASKLTIKRWHSADLELNSVLQIPVKCAPLRGRGFDRQLKKAELFKLDSGASPEQGPSCNPLTRWQAIR
jgi:hypothetical protein